MTYFTLPMRGTPYNKFHHVENGEVTAIDVSRPDGDEIPYPVGVKFNLKPVTYDTVHINRRKGVPETVTRPRRHLRVDAGSLDDL